MLGNVFGKKVVIFGADGSASKHSENRKDDLMVLDKALTVIKRVSTRARSRAQ